MPSREEIEKIMAPPPEPHIDQRHRYKEAFIMSPKLLYRIVEVANISDGIALLEALGEGQLFVSTKKRDKKKGYFSMAKCEIAELAGKTKQEIITLLDNRTDQVEAATKAKLAPGRSSDLLSPPGPDAFATFCSPQSHEKEKGRI